MTQNQKCYYFTLLTHKQTSRVIKVINRSAVGTLYIIYYRVCIRRMYIFLKHDYIFFILIFVFVNDLSILFWFSFSTLKQLINFCSKIMLVDDVMSKKNVIFINQPFMQHIIYSYSPLSMYVI